MLSNKPLYRNIAAICIGFSLMAPMLYSVQFYAERMLHRVEMWRTAEKGLLQTINLDSAQIHWTKKNRELIVNGEYFDIVSIAYHGGKATIQGVFDHEETEMHEAFAASQEKDGQKGHATQQIANWLQTCWFFMEDSFTVGSLIDMSAIENGIVPHYNPTHGSKPPLPPPWHLSHNN
jgi:hypothetical protein